MQASFIDLQLLTSTSARLNGKRRRKLFDSNMKLGPTGGPALERRNNLRVSDSTLPYWKENRVDVTCQSADGKRRSDIMSLPTPATLRRGCVRRVESQIETVPIFRSSQKLLRLKIRFDWLSDS
jgi:hypothetical protein